MSRKGLPGPDSSPTLSIRIPHVQTKDKSDLQERLHPKKPNPSECHRRIDDFPIFWEESVKPEKWLKRNVEPFHGVESLCLLAETALPPHSIPIHSDATPYFMFKYFTLPTYLQTDRQTAIVCSVLPNASVLFLPLVVATRREDSNRQTPPTRSLCPIPQSILYTEHPSLRIPEYPSIFILDPITVPHPPDVGPRDPFADCQYPNTKKGHLQLTNSPQTESSRKFRPSPSKHPRPSVRSARHQRTPKLTVPYKIASPFLSSVLYWWDAE